jgi:RecB family exonuclease
VNASLSRAFADDLKTWFRTRNDALLVRALRSPCSGVPHDTAAAYATVAARVGPLLDAIARLRIAVSADERDALLRFSERVRSIDEDTDIAQLFELESNRDAESVNGAAEIDLTETQTPDRTGPVRARQTHFSASALNAYAECARKWYFRYACAAIEDPGSSASTYGTAFHAALEDFHGEFPQPSSALESEMRQKIVGYVNWAFERYRNEFDTAVEVELHKRRAQRTAQRYVDWLLAESIRAPFTVIGREIATQLDLEGFAFVGYIDRIDRDDRTGSVAIIDYKTGSIATSAAEYRDKVRRFRDFQLPFYYWSRTAEGDRVAKLALIPLKDALLDVAPISLEVVPVARTETKRSEAPSGTIPVAELELARSKMIEICRDLTSGALERFPVTTDPSACTYCAYADACPDKPRDERERFGR